MIPSSKFSQLNNRERALVAIAVLLDGGEALEYLRIDRARGEALRLACEELLSFDLDMRLPYAGTALRRALEEAK